MLQQYFILHFLSIVSTDSMGTIDVFIAQHTIIEGQASGEWVTPGTYTLQKGNSTTVTVTTKGADSIVAADALLFVPDKK